MMYDEGFASHIAKSDLIVVCIDPPNRRGARKAAKAVVAAGKLNTGAVFSFHFSAYDNDHREIWEIPEAIESVTTFVVYLTKAGFMWPKRFSPEANGIVVACIPDLCDFFRMDERA